MDKNEYTRIVSGYAESLMRRCEESLRQGKPLNAAKLDALTAEVNGYLNKYPELTEERARCEARLQVYTSLKSTPQPQNAKTQEKAEPERISTVSEQIGTLSEGTNDRTGEKIYQVRLDSRLTREEWDAVALRARKNKGYYYRKGGCFVFSSEQDATNFNNIKDYERHSETSIEGDLRVQGGVPDEQKEGAAKGTAGTGRTAGQIEEEIIETDEKIALESENEEEIGEEIDEEEEEEVQSEEKAQRQAEGWRNALMTFTEAAKGLSVSLTETSLTVTNAKGETIIEHRESDDEIMKIIMPFTHSESINAEGYSKSLSESSLALFSHITANKPDLQYALKAINGGEKGQRDEASKEAGKDEKPAQPSQQAKPSERKAQSGTQLTLDLFGTTESEKNKETIKNNQDNERDSKSDTRVSGAGVGSDASESPQSDSQRPGGNNRESEGNGDGISGGGNTGDEHRRSERELPADGRDRGEEPVHGTDRGAEGDDTGRGQGDAGNGGEVLSGPSGGNEDRRGDEPSVGGNDRGAEGRGDKEDSGEERIKENAFATRKQKPRQPKERVLPTDLNNGFYMYEDNLPVMGEAGRLDANIAAIETIVRLDKENREVTEEEKRTLSLYTGFGGLNILAGYIGGDYYTARSRIARLRELTDELDPNGDLNLYSKLLASTSTAYYTDIDIAKAVNGITEKEGFKGGLWLDPAMGSGHFEGAMPQSFVRSTEVWGCEPDIITGRIAQILYPEAHIEINTFQSADLRMGKFDVVTTNDPFGVSMVSDGEWMKNMTAAREVASKSLHGYFAVKKIEAARDGGLINFITSTGVMDTNSNSLVREYIADTCEIVGALRMPNTAFKASGTKVVADIILLRKFSSAEERMRFHENSDYRQKILEPFLQTAQKELVTKDGEKITVDYNAYFEANPDRLLGYMAAGGMYSADGYTILKKDNGKSVAEEIEEQAGLLLEERRRLFGETIYTEKGGISLQERDAIEESEENYTGKTTLLATGNLVIQNGKVGILRIHTTADGKEYAYIQTNETTASLDIVQTRMYIALRDSLHTLMAEQLKENKEGTDTLRARLHEAYESYTAKYGRLYDRRSKPMKYDLSSSQVFALEKTETLAISKDGSEKTQTKTEITGMAEIYDHDLNISTISSKKPETAEEAITRSLSLYASIDEDYMIESLGEDWLEKCNGRVFEKPYGGFEIKELYLSGDVVTKLEEARQAAKENERFERNVAALEEVQPKKIEFGNFPAHMGARWIPVDVYNEFLKYVFGIEGVRRRGSWGKEVRTKITYYEPLAEYMFNFDEKEFGGEAYNWQSGTKKCKDIFEAALLDKDIAVWRMNSEGERELDREATREANAKVQEMREAFEDWLPTRNEIVDAVEFEYNRRFNRTVLPKWDGSHLDIPSLAGMKLRQHQKDAVWMLLNNKGGIVDHMVGAGKTLVMQTSVMEMKRTGIARKPMLLVWKSTLEQVVQSFQEAFPSAKILAPSKQDFTPENRDRFFAQITLNDYDAIIVTHEQFEKFNHTKEARLSAYKEEEAQLIATVTMLDSQPDKSSVSKRVQSELTRKLENLRKKIEKEEKRQEGSKYYFEKMGIDCLIVDESHSFKNLRYFSQYNNVAGMGTADGSNKANNLLIAIRHIQKVNGGDRGVVFLSGTTVSNSLTEMYNIFNYLRPAKMRQLGLNTFDAWASTFARRSSEPEFGVTTELKQRIRFRKFEAVKELSALYNEIADVRNKTNLSLPRPAERSHLVTIKPSETVRKINSEIIKMVKNKDGGYFNYPSDEKTPWGLLAANLGKKLTVSPKLINEEFDDERGKIFYLCENIKEIYDKFDKQKGVQLIFLDTGVNNKDGAWNAYDAIIDSLADDYGIPREEIVDIHVADSEIKRKMLFERVNKGEVRILIGGTKNMGTGVNVQKRVVAMHHMDIPWTPSDTEQRNGRGVRQGNEVAKEYNNNEVDIYYYAVEQTIDTYRYQLQDTKGKMIDKFKNTAADMETFEEQDGDEEGMKWATMMSILSGNPLVLEKKKCEDKVESLERRRRGFVRDQAKKREAYRETTERQRKIAELIRQNGWDKESVEENGFKKDEKGEWPKIMVSLSSNFTRVGDFELNSEFGENLQKRIIGGEKLILKAYGAKASIEVVPNILNDGKRIYEMSLRVTSGIKYAQTLQSSALSWGQAFGNALRKVITNSEKYAEENERLQKMLQTMPTGEEVFPKEQELREAKARLDEVTRQYEAMAEVDENEQKQDGSLKAFIGKMEEGRVVMPKAARELILDYSFKYAIADSGEQKSEILKEAVERLTGIKVVMFNKENIYDVAVQNGENEEELEQIRKAKESMTLQGGGIVAGFVTSDKDCIYINEDSGSIRNALAVALHEYQHLLNRGGEEEREQFAKENGEESLHKTLRVFNKDEYYENIKGGEIVDEIIAHAVIQQYYGNDPEKMLRKAGIEERIINKIKEKTDGNRTSYSKFLSRWNAPYDEDEQENIRENDGNKEKRSTTVGEERFGPDETSREGARNVIDFYVGEAVADGGFKVEEKAGSTTYSQMDSMPDGEYVGNIRESVDTRNGERIFVVQKTRYVTREEFAALCERAREYGGYYTRFPLNRGFVFETEEQARNFNHITEDEEIKNEKTEENETLDENRSGAENQTTQNEGEDAGRGAGEDDKENGRDESAPAEERELTIPSYTEQEDEWNRRLDLLQAELNGIGFKQQRRALSIDQNCARLSVSFQNDRADTLSISFYKNEETAGFHVIREDGFHRSREISSYETQLTNEQLQDFLKSLDILTNMGSISVELFDVSDLINETKSEAEKETKDYETAIADELIGETADTHKIQDYGEHIKGARKDAWSSLAIELEDIKQQSLLDNPLSKVFRKPNLVQLKNNGMSDEDIIMVRAMTDNIERVPKPAKRKSSFGDSRRQEWVKQTYNKIGKLKDYIKGSEEERELTRKYYHSISVVGDARFDDNDFIAFDVALLEDLNFTADDNMDNFLRGLEIDKWSTTYFYRNKRRILSLNNKDWEGLIKIAADSCRLLKGDIEGRDISTDLYSVKNNEEGRRESEDYVGIIYNKGKHYYQSRYNKSEVNAEFARLEKEGYTPKIVPVYETYTKNYILSYTNLFTGEEIPINGKVFDTFQEAYEFRNSGQAAYLVKELVSESADGGQQAKESTINLPEIGVYYYRYKMEADGRMKYLNGEKIIALAILGKKLPTGKDYIFGYFDSIHDAQNYLEEHMEEMKNEISEVIRSARAERGKVFFKPNEPRVGEDYRKGENITSEKLAETFGFRGVQFGNWANDMDRQQALNETYDALIDLAKEIGFENKMLSLNGELGIAFGARGGGNYSAHYEPLEVVINLTKTKGAGSLAHEWLHAIDNYFSRKGGDKFGMVTDKDKYSTRLDFNISNVVERINEKMKMSNYSIRCSGYGDYWKRPHEKWARLFAEWVHHRIEDKGNSSHYLSRGIDPNLFEEKRKANYKLYERHCHNIMVTPLPYEDFKKRHMGDRSGLPYPTKEESLEYTDLFQEMFKEMGEAIKRDMSKKELNKELMVEENTGNELLIEKGQGIKRDIYDMITDQLERCNLIVKYERIEDKNVKGYAQDYTITLNTNAKLSLETPLHEYTHIWCAAMERENPEEWERIKEMIRGTIYYQEVLADENYSSIANDEDRLASETLARISGRQGAKRMIEIEKKYAQETGLPYGLPLKGMRDKALSALKSLWNWTAEHILTGRQRPRNVEEVADLVLSDLLSGRDLRSREVAKADEEYKRLDDSLAMAASTDERTEILDKMQRIVNQEASDTLKDTVAREKSGQLQTFILTTDNLDKLRKDGYLRLPALGKEDTLAMQRMKNQAASGTDISVDKKKLNPVLEKMAENGYMTVFADIKRPVRLEERLMLGKKESEIRRMALEKDPNADSIIYLNELDQLETIVFSDKSLYAADALTQDEKDGKSLSERFASHDSEKEYFITGKRGAAALDDLDMMHRMDDLRTAMQYDRAGISAHDIKAGFFWEKGANGSWMYEVPLTDFASIEGRIGAETDYDGRFNGTFSLDDLPELKKLYPDEQLEIEININPSAERDRGYYHVKTEDAPGKITLNLRNTRYLKRGIVHEAQHFAQDMEGMPLGTSVTEIEKAKQTVRQLLKIEDGQTNDARLISDRIRTAGAKELEKSKRTAMAFGCDINHLLQTPTQYLYMTNYGETITRASVNRTLEKGLETEEDYASSLIRTELMFSAEDLWTGGRPETMEWKVNADGYVYNDRWQPLTDEETKEYNRQLKEELTAAANGDRIRFYIPLTDKEVSQMMKYGYRLPNRPQNAITTTRQVARPGIPLVVTVDIPKDNIDSIRRNAAQDGYILPILNWQDYRVASIRQSNEPQMFNYGGMLFCRQDGSTTRTRQAREQQTKIMVKAIEKVFPEEMRGKVRLLSHQEFEAMDENLSDYIPSAIGVTEKDGTVYIDIDRARVDTPLHELGVHRLMDIARQYSLTDIEKTILRYGETAPDTIKREVSRVYPDIPQGSDIYKEECAAMALGLQQQYRIEQFLEKEEYKTWYTRLTNYVSGAINRIKGVFLGKEYADLTPLQCLEGLSHEVIGNRLFSLIMSGREIKVDARKKIEYVGETRAQIIGEKGIKALAASGRHSEEAVIRYGETIASTYAKYLSIEGSENARDAKTLRLATDLYRSAIDKKVRMELVAPQFVSDEELKGKLDGKTTLHLKDVLKDDNAIFTAYPQLRDAEIVGAIRDNINNDFSNIQKEYQEIYDETALGEIRYRLSVYKKTLKEWKESVLHEIQHAIQTIEGFEEGYPFTTPLKNKEMEFLKKNAATLTATQLKNLSQSANTAFFEQYGIRRKAIPTIRELLALGKTKLQRQLNEMENALRHYTASAGENEAYAVSNRMELTKEERLKRPVSMDYFVDETMQEPSPINEFLRKSKNGTIEYNLFNMQDNMLSFAEQRARVSIIEIAQYYGYRIVPKQGMRCPILEHPSGDKIGILNPTNSASQGFWTIGDDTNKGVLYNFVASRVAMGIIPNTLPSPESNNPNFVVNKVVHDYLNIPTEIRQRNQDLQKRIESRLENAETPKDYMQYCKPCENTEFLSRRGMGSETIESTLFQGRMFNLDQERLAKDNLITKAGDNDTIGFPLWNSKGEMIGLERRCDDVKMFVQGSQKGVGVWHSNIPDRITDAVICETPLDAMAYHELQGNDNTIYFATAGNVCVEQINQINEILRANNDRVDAKEFQFHLANDNDRAGASFNLQYVKSQMRLKRDCATDNLPTENGYTQTLISYKTAEQRNEVLERLKKVLAEKEPELTNDKGELIVRLSEKNEQMKESILIQSKSGDMYATQTLCDALISATRLNRTKIEKAVTKDYNDDLKLLNLVHEREQGAKFSYGEIKLNKSLFEPEIKQIMEKKKPTAAQIRREKVSQYLERHKGGVKM